MSNPEASPKLITDKIDEHAREFFEAAPCGYLFTALSGQILRVNNTFCEWTGYSTEGLQEEFTLTDLVSRGSRIFFETHFFPLLNVQGSIGEIHVTLLHKDGSRIPVLISAKQHRDEEYNFLFNSVVVVNFAHREKYESELLEAKKRAESSDQAKSYFLSTVSHEVLTPLNAIIGMSNLLETTGLNAEQARLQSILSQSANHLLQLFKNILVISKDGLGKLEVARRAFDLRKLVHAVAGSFRYDTHIQDITLAVRVDERLPPSVIGDPTLISQLLTNLVGNAVKFTSAGEVNLAVTVKNLSSEAVLCELSVTDTGIGIPAEKLDGLFLPFTQATQDIHSQYGGSGLGLSICSSILDKLNSHMEVNSREGEGSRFSFVLNLPVSQLPTPASLHPNLLPEIKRGKVLLVEDNETNAYLVSRYFRQWKVAFDLSPNGAEALKCVDANDYDLILMDLQMPVMDGYLASNAIRALAGPKSMVPIVAFSASSSLSMSDRMREARIDDFLLKPFDPKELHAILLRYMAATPPLEDLPAMSFPQLREAFDQDSEELASFALVLERELITSAAELERAMSAADARAVSDLKHKLKTSLQLLDAEQVKDLLAYVTEELKQGRQVSHQQQRQVIEGMRGLVVSLKKEKW